MFGLNLFDKKPKKSRYANIDPGMGGINNAVTYDTQAYGDLVPISTAAGVNVNERTAMMSSAVYACVGLISGAIAGLPLPVYKRTATGRERVDHPLWWLLNEQPTKNYSAAIFKEALVTSLLLHGDGFARIIRANNTDITELEWIPSYRVTVKKLANGVLGYDVVLASGQQLGIMQENMIHVAGPGFDGYRGMSQLRYALRYSVGLALAADQYGAAFFENGARPDFVIELQGRHSHEQIEALRQSWMEKYGGVNRAHIPAFLTDGGKVHELTMNPQDAQLLSTREFQVEDIARIFGVPPHMIGHMRGTTQLGSSVEQTSIGFVKYTLSRYLVKIEQEINRKLWPSRERYYVEFNTAGLERGDYKTRMEGYRIALGRAGEPAWMTTNEVRRIENLKPVAGGDELNLGGINEQAAPATGA